MRWPLSRADGPGSLDAPPQPITPSLADHPDGPPRAQVVSARPPLLDLSGLGERDERIAKAVITKYDDWPVDDVREAVVGAVIDTLLLASGAFSIAAWESG